jgi:hypothetical protein
LADVCFVTDGGHDDTWRDHRINHVLLRQGIHEPHAHVGTPLKDHPPIVFIGTYSYPARMALIDALRARYGDAFTHYGLGGDRREVRGEDLNNILASAKIVVGDSVPSPHYWSNRIYEITGRGGFLMHPRVAGLEKEFIDGVHYAGYDFGSWENVYTQIDHYLTHEDARRSIQMKGHLLTREHYTYTKRCAKLLAYARV